MQNKYLYIIAGCNGAGKTTASYTVLPEILECKEFVNADEIARGLSPFNPDGMAVAAGRLMLQRIENLLVAKGGHNIPEQIIRRRYVSGIKNFFRLYKDVVDLWEIWDNTQSPRCLIASGTKNQGTIIKEELLFTKIQSYER